MFWKFCCFWPRSSVDAELQAVRAHQLGQLVAELQRVVVGVHVVGGGPEVADLAATAPAVEDVGRQIRAGRAGREDAVERDAAGALLDALSGSLKWLSSASRL